MKKACEVTQLVPPKYPTKAQGAPQKLDGGTMTLLRSCEYFNVNRLQLDGEVKLSADEKSFNSILVLDGSCTISANGESVYAQKGDSLFVDAGTGAYTINGSGQLIITDIV